MEGLELVWGWQPAAYLFLGGLGAGAFATAAVLFLHDREKARRALNMAMWAALGCLGLGLLFLVTELVFPLRGVLLWQSFSHFTSWMTFGAWVAFAAMAVFFACAVLTCPQVQKLVDGRRNATADQLKDGGEAAKSLSDRVARPLYQSKAVTVLMAVGLVLALGVAAYTGMLLMSAPGVPLWNSPFLPCLFTVSALDTGVALVELLVIATREPVGKKAHRGLEIAVVALVLLEAIALAALLTSALNGSGAAGAASAAAATLLLQGGFAPWFWLVFVGLGLVFPLAAAIAGLAASNIFMRKVTVVGAAGALVGGCALRFLVVFAGMHADYLAYAVALLN
ncbi:NrfD/PsrC family molybdoenzyme membrane anchor subunit [uncultured Adlercreutzia sp.]|uniref:NrfD/PsrC family molybdoenzyme membrane anchor subunit n=1 Tax=uncultured Adlercreutzia sp. TaxID=875803 RepID=UPI002675CEA2|nr:NrfD/PsrC family molybdoenzyme membrane anchor subunit [uncultured Adlercreutzia sp.]